MPLGSLESQRPCHLSHRLPLYPCPPLVDGWTPAKDTQPISRMTQFSPVLPTHWEGHTQQTPATAEHLHLSVLGNVCDLRLVSSLLTSGLCTSAAGLVGEGNWAQLGLFHIQPTYTRVLWGTGRGTQVCLLQLHIEKLIYTASREGSSQNSWQVQHKLTASQANWISEQKHSR